MGQAESGDNQQDSCFTTCLKQKRISIKKMPTLPHEPQRKISNFQMNLQNAQQKLPQNTEKLKLDKKQKIEIQINTSDTSLQHRLCAVKKKFSLQQSTNSGTIQSKQALQLQVSNHQCNSFILGLQSKFDKQVIGRAGITRCSWREKAGSQWGQSTGRSSKSRDLLINKIEEIKQKYYERQLEIEIFNEERDYQRQIEQINKLQKSINHHSLPDHSLNQIREIREKILKKLRNKKNNGNHNLSRDGSSDETVYSQRRILKKHLSASQLNRSNAILSELSLEEKIQFSQYSEQSLHEIRELDQQDEDYKSKMTNLKSLHKNPPISSALEQISKCEPIISKINQPKQQNLPDPITQKQSTVLLEGSQGDGRVKSIKILRF